MLPIPKSTVAKACIGVFVASLATPFPALARESGPFAGLGGNWTGSGTVSMTDGQREAIKCRATYGLSGDEASMRVSLTCASDSYKTQVTGDVRVDGNGRIAGSWQEATRGVSGDVSGRADGPGRIQVDLDGTPADIHMDVSTRGNAQSIRIRMESTEVAAVNVEMRRR